MMLMRKSFSEEGVLLKEGTVGVPIVLRRWRNRAMKGEKRDRSIYL